ncbi:MAG: LexA family protein [Intestinimonas sp.]
MKALTEKQRQIYDYIISFQRDHGYPPSVREIGEHVGLKSPSTVHFHLKGLEAAGPHHQGGGKPGHHGGGRFSAVGGRSPRRPGTSGGECGRRVAHSGRTVHRGLSRL